MYDPDNNQACIYDHDQALLGDCASFFEGMERLNTHEGAGHLVTEAIRHLLASQSDAHKGHLMCWLKRLDKLPKYQIQDAIRGVTQTNACEPWYLTRDEADRLTSYLNTRKHRVHEYLNNINNTAPGLDGLDAHVSPFTPSGTPETGTASPGEAP